MAAPLSCDSCEEMLADYLLHALELEVVQAVTEHLSTCVRCRAQLTASEAVLAHLAHGVPQRAPRGTRLAPAGRGRQRGSVHGLRSGAPAPTPTAPRGLPPDGRECRALPRYGVADLARPAGSRVGAPALAGGAAPAGGSPGQTSPRVIGAMLPSC
jgi:Putative zinc-finger